VTGAAADELKNTTRHGASMTELDIFCKADALLAEGPVWDARTGTLVWVDIDGRGVNVTSADGASTRRHPMPEMVGAAALREDGGLLLGLGAGFATLDLDSGAIDWLLRAAPGADPAVVRMNDGEVDPQGRFWCGTVAYDETPGAGALYRLDAADRVATALTGVTISNGMAWTLDGTGVHYIDTPTRRVDRFDYDPETGALSDRRTFVDTSGLSGWPDGMTIDAAGDLWVAFWGGWCVRRFSGADGTLLEELAVPAAHVSACGFGGPDRDRLFVTTARVELSEEELAEQPHAGSVFVCEPGATGVPATRARI
jgi:sugar lactone lactonase YvrE